MDYNNKIVEVALSEVGYSEIPKNSNKTKYGKWFGLNGVPWCGIFVSWCYWKAGIQLPKIGFSNGFAGCQTAMQYFSSKKQIVVIPRPGDLAFFDWNNDNRFDHVGIVSSFIFNIGTNLMIDVVEGNTSLGNYSNGGKVMERTRYIVKHNIVFVRPKILLNAE
ncbi:MAG: CHAP domain-containing protein [Saprospiraceae bacterium]|nr:CHAP domain-containing protein [Saprospiraceae bacterium]